MSTTTDPLPEWALKLLPDTPARVIDETTFAGRLERICNLTGLSQVQFAKRLGVPTATYRTWIEGATPTKPDPLELCLIVEREFGVPREWLAWGLTDTQRYPFYFDLTQGYGDKRRSS